MCLGTESSRERSKHFCPQAREKEGPSDLAPVLSFFKRLELHSVSFYVQEAQTGAMQTKGTWGQW